jgi:hypothetical protein
MSTAGAFAAMASTLQGVGTPATASPEQKLRQAIEILEASGDAAAKGVAEALRARLTDGGSLEELLELKVRRGGAHDSVHRRLHVAQRDKLLRELAAALPGARENRAKLLAQMIRDRDPRTAVFHGLPIKAPTSVSRLKTILR